MSVRDEFKTFDALIDWAAGHILKQLIAGEFRQGVYTALTLCADWVMEEVERRVES